MVENENMLEILNSMWIMLIGAFIIILCYALDSLVGNTPAFIFVIMTYFFMGFFIYIIYNPFKRIRKWKIKK